MIQNLKMYINFLINAGHKLLSVYLFLQNESNKYTSIYKFHICIQIIVTEQTTLD